MVHRYLLDYTYDLAGLYPDVNQFIYIHLNTAHEQTGQMAATLDNDIYEFLSGYLTEFQEKFDIVMFLHGDHGMRFGNWYKQTEAFQEMKLSAFFFIAPSRLLDKIPNSYATLWHNTGRLNSKLDIRDTIIWLT